MLEVQKLKIGDLAALVKSKRGIQGLRDAAKEASVSPSTLSRVEQGKIPDLQTLMKLCEWLSVPVNQFITEEQNQSALSVINPTGLDTPSIIAAHLRADKELSLDTAEALATMVRVAYETFTKKGKLADEERL